MKPDFGLRHLHDGYSKDVIVNFYGVPFKDIGFIAPHSYTAMVEQQFGDTVYALSFDFSDEIFAHLLTFLTSDEREQFGSILIGKKFPFSASFPKIVTVNSVKCHRGELQRGVNDEFIPFIITRIE